VETVAETEADGGRTIKLLCRLGDGQTVETVAMETPAREASRRRATVCVSTQVGCAVGCPFCATGRMGLTRSCTAAEVVDQVRAAAAALHRRGLGPVTHVVYMGMGEPLAAYDSTVESLRVLTGDAAYCKDPITGSGIGDAFAQAFPLAEALGAALDGAEVTDQSMGMHETYEVSPAALDDYMTGYAGSRFGESARFVRNYPTDLALLEGLLHQIQTPVKILNSDHDPMVPLSNAEYLAERLPRSELTVLDAGHFAWEDQADTYGDAALAWLDGGFAGVGGDG